MSRRTLLVAPAILGVSAAAAAVDSSNDPAPRPVEAEPTEITPHIARYYEAARY